MGCVEFILCGNVKYAIRKFDNENVLKEFKKKPTQYVLSEKIIN